MGNAVWGIGEGGSSARACPVLDTGVSFLGNCYVMEKGEERSAATGQAVGYGAGGNRVAGVSVRSAVAGDRSTGKLRRLC